ncbi:MAG TPA: alpha-1,4-glucan--maltose-1-phosphate maltosyltransferase [Methylomirabilota bacterium]|nr:alpha-1,4-glucan--maltose-1-phosphate maltosyltransferase [Methylomirabilota bacterium]
MAQARRARVPVRKEPGAPVRARKTAGARGELPGAADLKRTVVIENIAPAVDGGRYPVKREVGATFEVTADIFKEGHEVLVAFLLYRRADARDWRETPMRFVDNDRWAGAFVLADNARWVYTIEAFADTFRSWLADLAKRVEAGQDVASELLEGVALIRAAAKRARGDHRDALAAYARRLETAHTQAEAVAIARDSRLAHFMDANLDRSAATRAAREYEVMADRERARFAAWYEFFPRSSGDGNHGTFKDAEAQLDRAAAMGFDVVYLPPIHPIGRAHRKGKNNALTAQPGEPGSPWAIGGVEGGHDAVHPDLGTLDDFDRFVEAAARRGLEVALDFAIQASPDHPWVREHPEWFFHRPDGTIKYAENPPKKYQDVYPVNFAGDDPGPLWQEMKRVIESWIGHGVKAFRVDNPHTKPVRFWEWLIRAVQLRHPETIFLAEAFTRPKMMKALAKAGFTQSYTYFTWRNHKQELIDYFTEITTPPVSDYFRGNLWPNTPDILHEMLVKGGPPAFKFRLVMAATLSSLYGIYSGYELCENTPVREGSEEYLDSEKYQLKPRDWDAPGNLTDYVTRLNHVRRAHPALQRYDNLTFYDADDPAVLWYGKARGEDRVFVAVNLDPFQTRTSMVEIPLAAMGLAPDQPYRMREQFSDTVWEWRGPRGYVELDPQRAPAQIFVFEK